ncbi:uncharacterized protein LOC116805598 [Drosophila grimshawi]|uniref:uncharacterized protein LOC116805598 n=1 Tax=Drosophila grimshawi TaxID=7222 RepID=UPI000C871090|nr:uncharacterized protein LOC116805598 [Drosophila grimshawi]
MHWTVVVAAVAAASLLFSSCTEGRPQDLATGMLLAVAQVNQLVETGAAAHDEKEVEVLGQKMGGSMNFGFGDAMRQPIGRRRRSEHQQLMLWTTLYPTLI